MEPRSRASPEQFCVMIDFMERHGDLSRPQPGLQGRIKGDHLWQVLTNVLNSLGGGVEKPSEKWKKVWADWKTKTKKKYLSLRLQASGTGGGPSRRTTLSALEERVVAVIGVSAVAGHRTPNEPNYEARGGFAQDILFHGVPEEDRENNAVATPVSTINFVPTVAQPQHIIPHVVLATSPIDTPASPPSPPSRPLPPPPPPPSPPPPPHTPPCYNRRQTPASPRSTATTPRRVLLRARRNRRLTPFERASDQFAAVEQRRLQYEEARDKRLHEREMERLRLEAERIEVSRQHNMLLHQLSLLGQRLIDVITQQQVGSLPSTDPI